MGFFRHLSGAATSDKKATTARTVAASARDNSNPDPGQPLLAAAGPPPYDSWSSKTLPVPTSLQSSLKRYIPEGITADEPRAGKIHLRIFPPNYAELSGAQPTKDPGWVAVMDLDTADLPRLMREGFYWTPANVDRSESYMTVRDRGLPGWVREEFPSHNTSFYLRSYSLVSRPRKEKDREDKEVGLMWKAELNIAGKELDQVARFRLSDLHPGNVFFANASDGKGRTVYSFFAYYPHEAYNCIYDDLPLEGWWPWPKAER